MYFKGSRKIVDQTAIPDKYPQKRFNDKPCRRCGNEFKPNAPSHLYCSDACSSEAFTDNRLRRDYGISYHEYLTLLVDQGQTCAICGGEGFSMHLHKEDAVKLVVDHCHDTGKVRGLLCHNCNRALGLFKDDINNLKEAISYLEGATTIRKE